MYQTSSQLLYATIKTLHAEIPFSFYIVNEYNNLLSITDKDNVVQFVAQKLGITNAYGDLLPGDKVNKVKEIIAKNPDQRKKIVENFWNLKLICLPQDIFNLNYDKIEKLDGWGKLSVSNLKFSINQKKNIS